MKLDSGNRSFFALVGLVALPYVLLGLLGCGLLSLVVYRLVTEGLSGLRQDGQDLRPAAVFFTLVSSGTIIAALSVRRQLRATTRLARTIAAQSASLDDAMRTAADRVGLGGRMDLWDVGRPCSFTYGVFRPRVVVSRGLCEVVTEAELTAVLHHERYHIQNRDTLKVVVARAAPSAFFFLPALRALRDRYLAGRELAADRRAVRAVGERPLAGALYKSLTTPTSVELGAAAALGGSAFLDERVEQLELGAEPRLARLSRATVAGTAAGVLVLTGALALTLVNGGSSGMSMDRSMEGSEFGLAALIAGMTCASALAIGAFLLVRRARRRHGNA